MKNIALFFLILIVVAGCNPKNKEDQKLAKEVNFDEEIIRILRKETKAEFSKLSTEIVSIYPEREEREVLAPDAIEFEMEGTKSMDLIYKLKDELKSMGYYIFRSEQHDGYARDKIGVLKTDDQFDILKYQATNGGNYDIETDSIVNELRRWDQKYTIEILGAGFDWVEGRFIRTPEDVSALAKRMYAFCPDIVDQGTGSVEALEEELRRTNGLFLWWD